MALCRFTSPADSHGWNLHTSVLEKAQEVAVQVKFDVIRIPSERLVRLKQDFEVLSRQM